MAGLEDRERVEVTSAEQWRAWLARHGETSPDVWCVTDKKAEGDLHVPYEDVALECVAVGWVDSTIRAVGGQRSRLYCSPRTAGSGWSRPNKQRVEELEAAGRMSPAGRAAVEAAEADGSWSMLDDVENLVVPTDLAAAFTEHPGSRQRWESMGRSARRGMLEWIVQARRPATREKRVRMTVASVSQGQAANRWERRG